jgi:peptidyl-prolyl cis-trans isomerase A (cyclophilin A)
MRTLLLIPALLLAACSSTPTKSVEELKPVPKVSAPAEYKVVFDTSKGSFTIQVHKDLAPQGADRFYELVQDKFFDDARFFRVVKGFVVQFGINKDPKTSELWRQLKIPDDPVKESNTRGTITYATAGPGTRTTQLFINLGDNKMLDSQGFAPFGKVTDGMSVVDALYAGYGDMAPQGEGPDSTQIEYQGNDYLTAHFERLDFIKTAKLVP